MLEKGEVNFLAEERFLICNQSHLAVLSEHLILLVVVVCTVHTVAFEVPRNQYD